MSKKNIKGAAPENTREFHLALTNLLKEHFNYSTGNKIDLKTSDFTFKSEDVSKCKPECIKTAEVCDKNGENCHIRVWCECD